MTKQIIVDTNVFLRLLSVEKSPLKPEAKKILLQAQQGKYTILMNELVVGECLWVLSSYYHLSKVTVVDMLKKLILRESIEIKNKHVVLNSLDMFQSCNLSWVDCFLYCQSEFLNLNLITFDDKLARLCK